MSPIKIESLDFEQRCMKCIIPKTVHGISFDEEGICELCRNYNEQKKMFEHREKNIEDKIRDIKRIGKGRNYDCLVGLSGGRDSAYLLYLLVKKHKLRCMAAYHRTPFTPSVIDNNVKKLTKTLDVPLVYMNISVEKHRLFTKKMVKLWLDRPNNIIANLACAPCKQHNHEVYKIARKYDIGYIVFGSNDFETFQLGAAQDKKSKVINFEQVTSLKKLKQTIVVSKRGISILLRYPSLVFSLPTIFKNSILFLNNRTPYLRIRYPKIKMIDYYFLAGYDEKAVNDFLSEFDLKIPNNCLSTWRADCSFSELKNIMFRKNAGITYNDAYLSNMVRGGILSRDEALERIKIEGKISRDRLNEVCEVLEIVPDHF